MNLVRIFVYGTLRPGSANWSRDGFVEPPIDAQTTGTLYNYGGFPYLDVDGTQGTVYGNVVTYDRDDMMYRHVRRVELGAGYAERDITVQTDDGPLHVITYDASDETKRRVLPTLPVITSGDWLVAERENEEAYWSRRRSRGTLV